MIIQNVSMKEIQIWLGHSDFATTANIYAHIDSSAKVSAGRLMSELICGNTTKADDEEMKKAANG